jgi:hypothetical protein
MRAQPMPLASKRRALELAATFLENDLAEMRGRARQQYEHQQNSQGEAWDGREYPLGSSHEGDLMKAAEWASAIVWLRAIAEQEPPR